VDPITIGRVGAIFRYPVRSMRGEDLDACDLTPLGVIGDRCYSVVDPEAFAMASASSDPKSWSGLLEFRAAFAEPPQPDRPAPPVVLLHDGGETIRSDSDDCEKRLSERLGRAASLWSGETRGAPAAAAAARRSAESPGEAPVPEVPYPSAPIHLLTTSSVRAAEAIRPGSRFDPRRFRPNLLIDTGDTEGFVEAGWLNRSLRIGGDVELRVFEECERCAMTTLPQQELERDPRILATITRHNRTRFGIYLSVSCPGTIRRGDPVRLLPQNARS
jgi:uncharacterized protein YcbX